MQRGRKDHEILSNSRFSTVSSVRRESDRLRIPKCLNLSMISVIYDTRNYCQGSNKRRMKRTYHFASYTLLQKKT